MVPALSASRLRIIGILIVVFIALGGVGSYFMLNPRTDSRTMAVTPYVTTVTGSAPATVRPATTYRLSGRIFFDYNGNGKQDEGEPAVPNVTVALNGVNVTSTNATGGYTATGVSQGSHRLRVFPPSNFRYLCESDAEFRSVKEYYTISVGNDAIKDLGLMEGFLTMPFSARALNSSQSRWRWKASQRMLP